MNSNNLKALLFSALLMACGKKTEETMPIQKDITETVFASGVLEAHAMYSLTAQTSGYITQLYFKEGDVIPKGKTLAVIEDKESPINTQSAEELLQIAQSNTAANAPQLLQATYSIDIAKQKMEQDALQVQRYKRLWESNSIAKIDYENALLNYNTSKKNYETALEAYQKLQRDANQQLINTRVTKQLSTVAQSKNQITALVAGKVFKQKKQVGDFVRQGDVIAELGDAHLMYAKVNIDESNIKKVQLGQQAVIQLNVNKDKVYTGTVREISPSFDDASQSFLCKIYFTDVLDFTIANTQLQVNITVGTQKNALLIPRNYIDFGGFVQIKGNSQKTKVQTQFVSNEWVQVSSGIDKNTVLVTDNIASNNTKTSEAGSQMR